MHSTLKGGNSAISCLPAFSGEVNSEILHVEAILSYTEDSLSGGLVCRKASTKSRKVFPFLKTAGKHVNITSHLKVYGYTPTFVNSF